MTTQTELFPAQSPAVDAEDVAYLAALLAGIGWRTAGDIASRVKWMERYGDHPGADRRIRAIASASNGRILSYPGSPGYRLTREASIEEIQTATAKLRHQANEMTRRAVAIDRIYHGKK